MAKDPYRYFRIEARELVDGLRASALALERSGAPGDTVAKLLRVAHTLKGAARVVRLAAVADLAHRIEELLAPYRAGASPVGGDVVTAVLVATDEIAAHLDALGPGGEARASAPAPSDQRAPSTEAVQPGSPMPPAAEPPLRRADERVDTTRVPLTSLDALLDALLLARAEVHQARARDPAGGPLDALDRRLADLQAQVGELRLVTAESLTTVLERAARDAARLLDRRVDLAVRGTEVALDAPVLAGVQEALVQLLRNAVAHAIEPPDERERAGKPPAGRVEVSLARRADRVVVRCSDDGRGIDVAAVRRAAIAQGALTPDEASRLDLAGTIDLLLRGGLSTAGAVTHASGRGVGLDVVRDVADRVSGELAVESEQGRGTTVTLTVPASLAALPALAVVADGERLLLPLEGVVRVERVRLEDAAAERGALVLDGAVVRFAPLEDLLGIEGVHAQQEREREASTVVLLAGRARRAAVGVERLLGAREVLLRPLPAAAGRAPLVAGATIDVDGRAVLVLDPSALVDAVLGATPRPRRRPAPALPVLVIDDSLTTRMLEETILTAAGYEVETATSAEEGLSLARARRYGLFVVDVEMPGMSGFEFVARTRADPELRRTPALLVTSRDAPEDRRRGLDAGASAYVVKSEFDEGRLLELVARHVRPHSLGETTP